MSALPNRVGRAGGLRPSIWLGMMVLAFWGWSARGADLEQARQWRLQGDYSKCIEAARQGLQKEPGKADWALLLTQALRDTGQYEEARKVVLDATRRHWGNIRLLLLGYKVLRETGQETHANLLLRQLNYLGGRYMDDYQRPADLICLGHAALLLGADPKLVLENFYDRAKQAAPDQRESYLAIGDLALKKEDSQMAAKVFREGLERFPKDPDLLYGLAKSFFSGDRRVMLRYAKQALTANPHHVPTLLLLAEHAIDAEAYGQAEKWLKQALSVNPWSPAAWAFRSVVAHLQHRPAEEKTSREKGLHWWAENPEVDYLIGKKLSQKYRFLEGADLQQQSLKFDPEYLPAKIQLAQDLLRLGEEQEGWRLAQEVHRADGYNVEAFNLVELHHTLEQFQTLTNDDFVLRMVPKEAALYGNAVLHLLGRAKRVLCAKYGLMLTRPVTVEIFPEQKDFAVRTFGLPDNPGYLGVCFGQVITANSPAAQEGDPENWQSILWHEFCHVVTLHLTRNRMPRWLSEGISVYEERQANPAWGQRLNPRYREMLLGKDFIPIADLSAAFLAPKSALNLQFAYYESSLVVEFLVSRYGPAALRGILADLGENKTMKEALEAHADSMKTVEEDFAAYAKTQARALAPDLNFTAAPQHPFPGELVLWTKTHPNNYYLLLKEAKDALRQHQWAKAKAVLVRVVAAYPGGTGPDSAYRLLADAYRGSGETQPERRTLAHWADRDGNALEAFARLMDLDTQAKDWRGVELNARRALAVNPLIPGPYRFLARAAEALRQPQTAIQAYRKLLVLGPTNPAEIHFRLARLLYQTSDPTAKRQLLEALEQAPRYRAALRLLLEMDQKAGAGKPSSPRDDPLPKRPGPG